MKPTLIHIIASNVWTGRDRYALDICRHFSSQGWRVAVLTRDARAVDSFFKAHSIPLLHAPLDSWSDWRAIMQLRREIRINRRGGTIIHAHRYRDALRALIARALSGKAAKTARIVVTRHTSLRADSNPIYRFIYRAVDAHIFMSQFSLDRFLAGRPDNCDKNAMLVGGSLFPDDVAPDYVDVVAEPQRGPRFATYNGRLMEGKGLEVLIDALSLLPDLRIRLRICGTGNPDYVDRLRQRAISRGVMERIDWHRRYDQTPVTINESVFGVFPAVRPECFGLNLLQFMANGRPVITTVGSAPGEYLTDGVDALLVRPGDATQLAAAIRKMTQNGDFRRKLGANALHTFRSRLGWNDYIARLSQAYGLK